LCPLCFLPRLGKAWLEAEHKCPLNGVAHRILYSSAVCIGPGKWVDMIRVLLVNEFRLMANVIAATLEDEDDIQVIGCATMPEKALTLAAACDVALVSTRLPDDGALELIQAIVDHYPDVKVLALGLGDSEAEILQHVEAGAVGYVLKDDSMEEMLRNIRAAYAGEALVSPEIAAALMNRVNELAQQFAEVVAVPESVEFTPRERQVLELVAQDLTNQEIAERLFIEVGTVKNHVHSILKKLNVNSRYDAAAFWAVIGENNA
jgi:two-component system nitrate/nitrite response regulator NarL